MIDSIRLPIKQNTTIDKNDEYEYIDPINIDSSVIIKQYRLEKKLENTSPSLLVEEWSFKTKESIGKTINQINKLTEHELFLINKSSVTWWQKGNKLYFILPFETYVKYDVPKIKCIIELNL